MSKENIELLFNKAYSCTFDPTEQKELEQVRFRLLKELTYPTQEEICKALSEYFGEEITFGQNIFYSICETKVCCWLDTDNNVIISTPLPPHLITLIGKFYKGVLENETKKICVVRR